MELHRGFEALVGSALACDLLVQGKRRGRGGKGEKGEGGEEEKQAGGG